MVLYRTLAEGLLAEDDRALVVLQAPATISEAGADPGVDQHHHRRVVDDVIRRRIETQAGIFDASLSVHDKSLGQEGIRYSYGAVEDTAWVVSEIQYQAFQVTTVFLLQVVDRIYHIVGGL